MNSKELKEGISILKEEEISNDKLDYVSTISIANQPIFIFKNKYNKEVRLDKINLRKYFVVN